MTQLIVFLYFDLQNLKDITYIKSDVTIASNEFFEALWKFARKESIQKTIRNFVEKIKPFMQIIGDHEKRRSLKSGEKEIIVDQIKVLQKELNKFPIDDFIKLEDVKAIEKNETMNKNETINKNEVAELVQSTIKKYPINEK